jgi:predicted metal-dependent phosphoesterase TrpH
MKIILPFFISLTVFFIPVVWSHGEAGSVSEKRIMNFPDTTNAKTIISDLHTHSVFSDGHVWPNVRVTEATRDGIDLLAITEHLEYQPHLDHIPHTNRNAAYLEAKKAAKDEDLIVVSGSEITREMPPGHINAIFLQDSNDLLFLDKKKIKMARLAIEESGEELSPQEFAMAEMYALANQWPAVLAVNEANKQKAFVFWNHPGWTAQSPSGVAKLTDMHKTFIASSSLHGIEIVNGDTFSEEAFQIALDNKLTLIGTSDVHDLIDWDYPSELGSHRPVTLIFSEKRNKRSIKKALFERRTVIWFKNILIGESDNLVPLLESILSTKSLGYSPGTKILKVELLNNSSANLQLQNMSDFTFRTTSDLLEVPANGRIEIQIKTLKKLNELQLDFKVMNAFIEPKIHPIMKISVKI